MSARVRRARLTGAAAMGVVIAVATPWLGWELAAIFVIVAINLIAFDRVVDRLAVPERYVAGTLLFTEAAIGLAVVSTGGATSPLLPWMAVPVGLAAARFRPRVVHVGFAIGAVLTALAAIGPDPAAAWAHPWLLAATLALEVNVVAIASALQGAELQHRDQAILDPLTDLLNRSSLEPRFAELREQALRNEGSVAMIALDVDRFKEVNDAYGHAVGDAVLRDLSYEMRKSLRNFELLYRYGGEEFVVVLPGAELDQALAVAERMREAAARARPAGLALTVSAGAAAARGEAVSFETLFEAADQALYEAKREGRDRVFPVLAAPVALDPADRRQPSAA